MKSMPPDILMVSNNRAMYQSAITIDLCKTFHNVVKDIGKYALMRSKTKHNYSIIASLLRPK